MKMPKKESKTVVMAQVGSKLKKDFKAVCHRDDISMSRGIRLCMMGAVKGKFAFNGSISIKDTKDEG